MPNKLLHAKNTLAEWIHKPFGIAERFALRNVDLQCEVIPVWIIGPPRSGSTLFYNLFVNCFECSYISNFAAKFPYSPYLVSSAQSIFDLSKNRSYSFKEGETHRLGAPHEAWPFLYRWFPKGYENMYVSYDQYSADYFKEFKKSVIALQSLQNGPFVLKNTVNSLRIGPLMKVFPKSLFVVCERDPIDVCQSVFRMREKRQNPLEWYGAAPKQYHELKNLSLHEQVTRQVCEIYHQIELDRNEFNLDDQMIFVRYEELCENTEAELNRVIRFLEGHGLMIHQTGELPDDLVARTGQSVPNEDYNLLKKYLDECRAEKDLFESGSEKKASNQK